MTLRAVIMIAAAFVALVGCSEPSPHPLPEPEPESAASPATSTDSSNRDREVDVADYHRGGFSADSAEWTYEANAVAFTTPSSNISCEIHPDASNERGALACLIREHSFSEPEPADCHNNWVTGFVRMDASEATVGACLGDVGLRPFSKTLEYGTAIDFDDITCTSRSEALYCHLDGGGGVTLTRDGVDTGDGAGRAP